MKRIYVSVLAILITSLACLSTPSESAIQTASAWTESAEHTSAPQIIQSETPPARPTNTPPPTETPIPTPTNTPEPTPLNLLGTGDSIVDVSSWPEKPGLIIVEGNAGGRYFGVIPYDKNGNRMSSIVNTTDPYKGVGPFNFDGEYATRLEIKATGNWTIKIVPLSQARMLLVPGTIEGNGDDVIVLTGGFPDLATITGNAESRYFGVIPYNASGKRLFSLVNTTESYQGTVIVERDTVIIEIKANGSWSIAITAVK